MNECRSTFDLNSPGVTRANVIWIIAVALSIFVIDLLTKIWAFHSLQPPTCIHIIPGFLRLLYGENPGIAFGLFQDHGGILHILSPIAFVVLLIIVYKQIAEVRMDGWYLVMFSLLIGGAMGNIANRLYSGYVIDFIDVYYQEYRWPTFNVADSALTIGVVILIAKLLFWKQPTSAIRPAGGGESPSDDKQSSKENI
ncbi:MAG: signal peptidase II [Candidatus Omnitrophota bacterium]|jgi:signal peptidase II|nr:MAG: signal peptidase II [Candidatus Omnitrophota bacterium]